MSERKPTNPDDPRGDFESFVSRSNRDRDRGVERRSSSACVSISMSTSTSTASSRTPGRSQKQPRQKHSEVVITGTSSSPVMPDLSSASPSPSISSVDTRPGSRSTVESRRADNNGDGFYILDGFRTSPLVTDGATEPALSRASLSSWDTAAPSVTSATPSIPASLPSIEQRTYACLFHMLDCYESFDDAAEWRTHVFSHFRSHPTPPSARCPLCPNTKFVDGIPEPVSSPVLEPGESVRAIDAVVLAPQLDLPSAWHRMLDHVAMDHYRHGQTLAGSRPDFELMRYLYGMRVITDAQFKAMQLPPAPSSPAYHRSQDGIRASIGSADEPYCAPYSKRREERMRGQHRGVGVV
ncbi:uncharacterized protein N7515_007766 [Penicillium bovifimosum]|uniref:Uncharacterized protein n=1 Tax=Penicillium bovifimosum TaxID=126998 RepID=A0A9W9KX34_9EURO|nr:uncharacterized protein N7515_007766 [Penicillium bovifimosum]KAJ5123941.1 hypothetical protein N7515_007766 [Penicillium bovifimosum]